MKKSAIKDLVYGGLEEIINNRDYYYQSSVKSLDYSHFTEEGRRAVAEFLDLMALKIREAEQEDLDQRAKKQVIDQLKSTD